MKTIIFFTMVIITFVYLILSFRRKPSTNFHSVDAIVPAYNEEFCLEYTLSCLLTNPYIHHVICVNDGSNDGTEDVLKKLSETWPDKLLAINQANTGKGGALMHALEYVSTDYVFLTDADTYVPPDSLGLGYMITELERGADAVGGVPSSNLKGAGLIPHIRATIKMPMIIIKRTFQQLLGGAPFIISGACGMFKTEILRKTGFSDRTRVEDLDLSWTLIERGYHVRQTNRCVVYPQECNSIRDEWKRWRRWIAGYAVCMKLHKNLLLSRFGILTILPMVIIVFLGIFVYTSIWLSPILGHKGVVEIFYPLFPLMWLSIVFLIGGINAVHHKSWLLLLLAPLSIFYLILAYLIWVIYGISALFTGQEPSRDKPTRYAYVVEKTRHVTPK